MYIKIGMIGADRAAESYLSFCNEAYGVETVAIWDEEKERAHELAQRFHVPSVDADYRRLLERSGIDAVIVCGLEGVRTSIAEDALKQGKHVLCENPGPDALGDIPRIVGHANLTRKTLMMARHLRFHPELMKVKEFIGGASTAVDVRINIQYTDKLPERLEVDDLLDVGWYLLGRPLGERAFAPVRFDHDHFEVVFRFTDDRTLTLQTGPCVAELPTTGRRLSGWENRITMEVVRDGENRKTWYPNMNKMCSYAEMIVHFVHSCHTGGSSLSPGDDVCTVARMLSCVNEQGVLWD